MAPAPAVYAVVGDVLWCLGLGCLLALVRDGLAMAFGRGPLRDFAGDIAAAALAAVAVFGFSAQSSGSGLARWYMGLAVLAGAVCWYRAVVPVVHRLLAVCLRMLFYPLQLLHRQIFVPIGAQLHGISGRFGIFFQKKRRKSKKSVKKQLQNPTKILYN